MDYADCYQGLIRLIIENNQLPSCFMNICSWGFELKDGKSFDIPKNRFKDLLYKYYGLKKKDCYWLSGQEYIRLIRENINDENKYVLLKVDVTTCHWNTLASQEGIYHFLLVTECDEVGNLKGVDIFYPEKLHEYNIADNYAKCRKIAILDYQKKDLPEIDIIRRDLVNSIKKQLNRETSPFDNLVAFAGSDFLEKVFCCEDAGQYDIYELCAKRLSVSRSDIAEIIRSYLLPDNNEVIEQWDTVAKQWRKFSAFLIKNQLVPAQRNTLLEKTRKLLIEISEAEKSAIYNTLECLESAI